MFESYIHTHTYTSMSGSYFRLLNSDRFAGFALQKKHVAKCPTARRKNNFCVSIFSRFYIRYSNKKYQNNALAIHKLFMPARLCILQ